jgi:ribonucleoside-diphosphate reductase alpha chain
MAATGNPYQIMSLSNCLVTGPSVDSYGGILKADEHMAQLMKRRAGVGHDLSHLRPRGCTVRNAAQTSTGAASFMDRFSQTTGEVAQGGRRGALMLTIDIRHPDSEEFVDKKLEQGAVTNANISVRIRNDFMEAARAGETFTQRWPVDADPEDAEVTKEVDAARLWHKIVENAHESAEPGILFWDRIISESPADEYADVGFKTASTNPCGEVPLPHQGCCRLLAVNWLGFVEDPFTAEASFDWNGFYEASRVGQRLMDDIVELEIESIQRILDKIEASDEPDHVKRTEHRLWSSVQDKAIRGRRTGLGMTALGDTLAALGIRYGSEESIEFAEKAAMKQKQAAYESSVEMAEERGAFPEFDASKEEDNPFLDRIESERPELRQRMRESGRRNIACLSIAPTGTVSLMAETTSGVENLFQPYYFRSTKVNNPEEADEGVIDYWDDEGTAWQEWIVFHPRFKQWLQVQGVELDYEDPDKERLQELYEDSPYHGATVSDVDWTSKVKMQGAIQRHIDHSISVTTNLPEDISVEKTKEVYETSYEEGCKGATIYRQGSRSGVLNQESNTGSSGIQHTDAPERPETLPCNIHQVRYNGDNWKVLVGRLDGDPYEVFAVQTGGDTGVQFRFVDSDNQSIDKGVIRKHGGGVYDLESEDGRVIIEDIADYAPDDEVRGLTRMMSLNLRHGTPIEYVVEQLEKANGTIASFSQSVLRALRAHLDVEPDTDNCPECGVNALQYKEGCVTCSNCGYSKCN